MGDDPLIDFVADVCGQSHLRVEDDLGSGFVRLCSDEAERRQAAHDIRSTEDIVIEMLRNARDAQARSIFLALAREEKTRRLVMIDDGDGIPANLHERVFEPRVTSKLDTMHMDKWGVHGRGMALYSISVNARQARIVNSAPGKGSSFLVETDLDHLGEKTDQSTFPAFEMSEGGRVIVRGPRNIMRTTCEFALESRKTCSVYLGSTTEIAATLYAFGASSLSSSRRAFCTDIEELPLCKRLCTASDPASFADIAESLGLVVSERSARRILDGEIEPVSSLLDQISVAVRPEEKKPADRAPKRRALLKDRRGMKIDSEDLDHFADQIALAYRELAERYYLDAHSKPNVHVDAEGIRIAIPFEKLR